jgi:chromosome partitioning protein
LVNFCTVFSAHNHKDSHLARIIAISNQKGGVGKTTTTINLAASLAVSQQKVLLVDLDPQGNATMGCGIDKSEVEHSVYDVLVNQMPIQQAKLYSEAAEMDVLASNADVTAAEVELLSVDDKERRLYNALMAVSDDYDFVIIDCPPSLNMLTLNGLVAADGVIIPMQCEYYALEGLSALLKTIEQIRDVINPRLAIEGVIRTMYDPRMSLTTDVSAQLTEHFGSLVYRTVIPRNVRLAEAPSYGLPAIKYDRLSKGAVAYMAMARELLRRREKQQAA